MIFNLLERHRDKWIEDGECYRWLGAVNNKNRPMVGVAGNKTALVSRLVCEEILGPAPFDKPLALHDTPNGCIGDLCVSGEHLRWGSKRDNAMDIPPEKRKAMAATSWAKNKNQRNVSAERTYARLMGEKEYFTGKPCKRGHVGPHRTRSGECIECVTLRNALRYRK